MNQKLIDVFKKTFALTRIPEGISQKNFDKWDSLTHINLIVEIENEFDIDFDPEEISEMIDFEKVSSIVADKLNHIDE